MANGRQLNSQPTNWTIDYNQDRRGEFWGNALANTGGILGSAIAKYAEDSRKKAEREAKEKQAMDYLKGAMNVDDEKAKGIVKGIGLDNFIQFQQLDQQKREADTRDAILRQQLEQIQAEKAKTERENEAYKAVLGGGGAAARSGVPPMLARNPMAAPQPRGPMSPEEIATALINGGVSPAEALKAGGQIDNMRPKEVRRPAPESFQLPGGRTIHTFNGAIIPDEKPELPRNKTIGTREEVEINGKKVMAEYAGGDDWIDAATKAPLYVAQLADPTNPFSERVRVANPVLFGQPVAQKDPLLEDDEKKKKKSRFTIIRE